MEKTKKSSYELFCLKVNVPKAAGLCGNKHQMDTVRLANYLAK